MANLVRSLGLGLSKGQFVSSVSFHPQKPTVAVAIQAQVYLFDLHNGDLLGKVTTEKQISSVHMSNSTLVARCGGDFFIWENSTMERIGKVFLSDEKSMQDIVLSNIEPYLCCSRFGSKAIFVHNVSRKDIRKPSQKLDCKRPASGLAMHPLQPLLAVYSEGTIRIWDLRNATQMCQCDELLKQKEYIGARSSTTLRGFLSFSGDGTILAVANEKKQLYTFVFEYDERQLTLLASTSNLSPLGGNVIGVQHHPRLAFFWVLQNSGRLEGFDSFKCINKGFVQNESISELDAVEQFCQLPQFQAKGWILPKDLPQSMVVHPTLNYIAFCFKRDQPRKNYLIYSLLHKHHRFSLLPRVASTPIDPDIYFQKQNFYSENFYYISSGAVMNYDIRGALCNSFKDFSFMLESTGFTPYEIRYCQEKKKFILFFENFVANEFGKPSKYGEYTFSVFSDTTDSHVKLTPGKDAFFPIFSKNLDLISLGGALNDELTVSGNKITLEAPVQRIFTSPLAKGLAVVYGREDYLYCSVNSDPSYKGKNPYAFDKSRKIKLRSWEQVKDILWNCTSSTKNETTFIMGILTSHRVIIADAELNILAFVEAPHSYQRVCFNSIRWVGMSLFYITESQVHYLTLDGNHELLCELDSAEATFVSIWNDRIITCAWAPGNIKVMANGVGLLQPLLLGELAAAGRCGRPQNLSIEQLQHVIRTYDYKRTDRKLIERLQQNNYYDVALQLSLSHSAHSVRTKFDSALQSRKLYTAMELLEEQCRIQKAAPPLHGEARIMAEELAKVCSKYGQYFLSYRCYELIQDYYTLLQTVVIHRDMHGLTFLKKRVQSKPEYAELHSACKKLMKNKQLMNGDATLSRDFVFTNVSHSYDATPIVVPDMQGNPKMSNPHIFPWAFLDTPQKWFSGRLNDAQNLGPSFSEPPQDAQAVEFPSEIQEIVSLFVLRMKGIVNEINTSEKAMQRAPTSLRAPTIPHIALSRDSYSVSSSSVLSKNQINQIRDPETSVVSMSESGMSTQSGEDDTDDEDPPSTFGMSDKDMPSDSEPEVLSTSEVKEEEPEEVNDPVDDVDDLTASQSEKIEPSEPEEMRNTAQETDENKEKSKPKLPTQIVLLAKDDLEKYPCASFSRWGYIGNLKRRDDLGKLAPIKVPVHEYFSAFDSITSAQRMLDIGMFSSALCHIEKAIALLLEGKSQPEFKRKELKICVHYKLAIRLLTAIKLLDHSNDIQEVAYLTRLLASISLKPIHRFSAMAIAADKNLLAENYGAASRLLRALKNKGLYESSNIEKALETCAEHNFSNSVGYISPGRPMTCFSTFKEIPQEAEYLFCNFCDAVFALEVKQASEICCFCMYGLLQSTQ